MAESDSSNKTRAHIPFLFYDVIGRMMPGAYLMFGAALCWLPFFRWQQLASFLECIQALGISGWPSAALVGAALLLFAFVSSFLGFLLGALSYAVVEEGLCHWRPLDSSGLVDFLGIENEAALNARFKTQFGSEPVQKKGSLNRSSFLCAYYIWRTNTALGEMQGRYDSDLLAARSFVLVSGALFVTVFIEMLFSCFSTYFLVWLGVLAIFLWASWLAFTYHRKTRVYGRFGMFLAITDTPTDKERR